MNLTTEIIHKHYQNHLNQTNNLVNYASDFIRIDHAKRVFPESLKISLRIPSEVKTMADYQNLIGFGYKRLDSLLIISICSDIEFMLKDICENIISPGKNRPKAYFQKLEMVNTENFIPKSINLNDYEKFSSIKDCFQIRHIFIHNMGFVDESFLQKTTFIQELDTEFVITQEIKSTSLSACVGLMKFLDEQLIAFL